MTTKSAWEEIDSRTARMKVPGGWIVKFLAGDPKGGVALIFVLEPNHLWVVEKK